ncbi:dihydroxyacetone kinase transcriptional activator DhaS [Secundilactobacillus collinoides]|nr:dihydroxyacetone kinase transcriptional activator DhaS [Secundilactobacillus collinoides]
MTTKNKIAQATKQLVVTQPFDRISVTNIMKTADLRRQSFYDYFHDKYDVLAWIYKSETDTAIKHCGNYRFWPQTLRRMLTYFADNHAFYRQLLPLDVQNAPEKIIKAHLQTMIGSIFVSMGDAEHIAIDTDYCRFLQHTLGDSLYASVDQWLTATDPQSLETQYQFLRHYLEDGMNGLLLRSKQIKTYHRADDQTSEIG